jgi:hypothetical protein
VSAARVDLHRRGIGSVHRRAGPCREQLRGPGQAYRVTLTNGSAAIADVTGFAGAFFASGTEDSSDQELASGFITPGQSRAGP